MFRHCPSCGGEFQAWVARCSECDVALVLEAELPVRVPRADLPHPSELACIAQGEPRALREIAARLQAAGISSRIDAYPPDEPIRLGGRRGTGVATSFGLYVLPDDAEEALRIRTLLVRETLPEATHDAPQAGVELAACPACGEPLGESARECASCGLEFPEVEE